MDVISIVAPVGLGALAGVIASVTMYLRKRTEDPAEGFDIMKTKDTALYGALIGGLTLFTTFDNAVMMIDQYSDILATMGLLILAQNGKRAVQNTVMPMLKKDPVLNLKK